MIRFTNTLTGRKEEFHPIQPGKVSLYVCGVTVYDDCHIGHARGAVAFDVLRRFLAWRGFQVTTVRNITDVDDKIIDRARREDPSPSPFPSPHGGEGGQRGDLKARVAQIAERYTESFQNDFAQLGLLRPDHEPRATEYILQMIAFIQRLLERDMAYVSLDGVYFPVRKLEGYARLSHQDLDQMLEGTRAEPAEAKKDSLDFALWKRAKPDEPSWDSPWGPGRPGWHIECTTMSTDLLGDTFDIHGGGQDLIFPHHENERAQALGAGQPFARYWLHNGLLTVGGQKMSKSLRNIVTIGEALERHSADVLRLFYLSAHYRSPLDFTWERLDEAAHAYDRLLDFLTHVEQRVGSGKEKESEAARQAQETFQVALEDDLNTPEALSVLYKLVTEAIRWMEHPGVEEAQWLRHAAAAIRTLGGVLGLAFSQEVPEEIQAFIRQRDEARRRRDFQTADQIRRRVMEEGYILEDTAGKTVIRKRI